MEQYRKNRDSSSEERSETGLEEEVGILNSSLLELGLREEVRSEVQSKRLKSSLLKLDLRQMFAFFCSELHHE